MYKALYQEQCVAVCKAARDARSGIFVPEDFLTLLEEGMSQRFSRLQALENSRDAHLEQIRMVQPYLRELSSEDTCLWCLRRRPETGLHCIHSICNICDRIFGTYKDGGLSLSYVQSCVLCGTRMGDLVISKLPYGNNTGS